MMCYYKKQSFVDKAYGDDAKAQWFGKDKPALQKKNGLMNLPHVIDGETVITQSNSCLLYLGRKLGIDLPQYIDHNHQALDQIMDLRNDSAPLWAPSTEAALSHRLSTPSPQPPLVHPERGSHESRLSVRPGEDQGRVPRGSRETHGIIRAWPPREAGGSLCWAIPLWAGAAGAPPASRRACCDKRCHEMHSSPRPILRRAHCRGGGSLPISTCSRCSTST